MKSKVIKKHYLKITFVAESPLAVGSGRNEVTDKDIIRRKSGEPFIPGASIAGVIREFAEEAGVDIKRYFGDVYINRGDDRGNTSGSLKNSESRLLFFDANLTQRQGEEQKQEPIVSTRDQVALDGETKTAIKGAKFDMQIIEPGIEFTTYVLQNVFDEKNEQDLTGLIGTLWTSNQVYLGSKTTRGYGEIRCTSIQECIFDMSVGDDVVKWIEFDMYSNKGWYPFKNACQYQGNRRMVTLKLKLVGGLSVRKYTTDIADDSEISMPDYEQMTAQLPAGKKVPVIPGTSWAGAFRHHMERLQNGSTTIDCYFGKASLHKKGKNTGRKSIIRFSETQITGGKCKVVSRNAIDRFTGGTVDKALFTERVHYGGETYLKISFDDQIPCQTKQSLAATILDLHYGFMAIGGLTSVGRGVFRVLSINGHELYPNVDKASDNYQLITKVLEGGA